MQCQTQNSPLVDLRRFASQFAAGVVVVSTGDEEGNFTGVTMTAVLSLSLNPPLFLISLDNNSNTLGAINANGHFCINFLSVQQADVSKTFASKSENKFSGVEFTIGVTGSPCITGAVAHGECGVQERYESGDHTILIGRLVRTAVHGGNPLVYHSGKYASLNDFNAAA
ncbi:flavin reductase [Mesorhizobium sp. M8A.F.Ca.ET.173.01.1.1]|nr:flavin reductase [Mesorhizobium sp. M8A.F.Ca.ET.173.01.1.1]